MIPRSAFVDVGMFDQRLRSQVDDLDLYLRLARKYRVTQHDFCVLGYRRHSSNISRDQEKMMQGTLTMLDRIEASDMLTPAERKHLRYGRNRWIHVFRPQKTILYRLRRGYYKVRAMLDVPLRAYSTKSKRRCVEAASPLRSLRQAWRRPRAPNPAGTNWDSNFLTLRNQCLGATTILSRREFNQAPHQEKVLLAMM